ncbi:reverse transcriptase domain-containing protein [Tanacetum coccineum]
MSGSAENRNKNKLCEFHGDKGHNTDECIYLKKQIEEAVKSEQLSHLIKELKQGNSKANRLKSSQKRRNLQQSKGPDNIYGAAMTIEHSTSAQMNFINVRSPSPYNRIIDRPGIRKIQVVSSIAHGMPKFPVKEGIVTLLSRIKVAIHPEYPEQIITIGGSLFEKGRMELCSSLKDNLDVFDWKPSTMTGVPRSIAEHRLNIREGCSPIRQKKIGQAPDINKAIQEEVKMLVEAQIMREGNDQRGPVNRKGFATDINLFISRVLQAPKINYSPMEKLILALVHAARRLRRYFQVGFGLTGSGWQAHLIVVITDQPIKQILSWPENARKMAKWTFELGAYGITYIPRTFICGQFLADFIAERPDKDALPIGIPTEEEIPEPWTLFTDGSLCLEDKGSKYDPISGKIKALINGFKKFSIKQVPRSENKKAYALSKIASTSFTHLTKQVLVEVLKEKSIDEKEIFAVVEEEGHTWMTPLLEYLTDDTLPAKTKRARAIKIKSRQYAIIGGVLYRRSFLEPWLRCVGPLQVEYVVRENHEGSCNMHSGPRFGLPEEIISDNRKQFRDNPFKE